MYESNSALQLLLWGLLPQSWQFTDERDTGMLAGIPRWEQLLGAAGFQKVGGSSTAGMSIRSLASCLHVPKAHTAAWQKMCQHASCSPCRSWRERSAGTPAL